MRLISEDYWDKALIGMLLIPMLLIAPFTIILSFPFYFIGKFVSKKIIGSEE